MQTKLDGQVQGAKAKTRNSSDAQRHSCAATILPSADELTTGSPDASASGSDAARTTLLQKNQVLTQSPVFMPSSATFEREVFMRAWRQLSKPPRLTPSPRLRGHKELRDKATPPLTMKELNDAEARCTAVVTLLTSITSASAKGETPDDFIKNNATAILATGLSNDDVKTMFSAVTLKSTLDTARNLYMKSTILDYGKHQCRNGSEDRKRRGRKRKKDR